MTACAYVRRLYVRHNTAAHMHCIYGLVVIVVETAIGTAIVVVDVIGTRDVCIHPEPLYAYARLNSTLHFGAVADAVFDVTCTNWGRVNQTLFDSLLSDGLKKQIFLWTLLLWIFTPPQ